MNMEAICPILAEVVAIYEQITPADIDRVLRYFTPVAPGEIEMGIVMSLEAQRLWAAGFKCTALSTKLMYESTFAALSSEEADDLKARGRRYDVLSTLVRDLCWITIKEDIGGSIWEKPEIGIRAGWIVVAKQSSNAGMSVMKKLLGLEGGHDD